MKTISAQDAIEHYDADEELKYHLGLDPVSKRFDTYVTNQAGKEQIQDKTLPIYPFVEIAIGFALGVIITWVFHGL